jgi:hypothetical protein
MRPTAAVTWLLVAAGACPWGTEPDRPLALGTWGGENAGVVVSDTAIHVHIGCTLGNGSRPVLANGHFEVTGWYNVTAHPVDFGVFHPAVFTGIAGGRVLTLTVTLTDTSITLGPVVVELGREPRMGPCPICRPSLRRRG